MSGRTLEMAIAFGLVLTATGGLAWAETPDGGTSAPAEPSQSVCSNLDTCLEALEALPSQSDFDELIDEKESAVQEALCKYGKAAIPALLQLLESKQPETRKMAAYTLSEIDGLGSADLPSLLRAFEAGQGRLARAIASVGTPAAIAALYEALKARPSDEWLPFAFARLGRAGVPTLMGAFDCRDGASNPLDPLSRPDCNLQLLEATTQVFEELGSDANDAVPRLATVANDRRRTVPVRRAAIKALAAIGPSAASVAPALEALARLEGANFRQTVEVAFFGLKVPAAGRILAARLRKSPDDERLLCDLAELGAGGQPAAKQVIALLDSTDWRLRVTAARALGYFGERQAVAPLVGAFAKVEDWQLAYVAAESLGRIGDASADVPLAALERDHWYPPVRESARKARAVIAGREHYASRWHRENFAFEFFEFEHAGSDVTPCRTRSQSARKTFLPNDDLQRALASQLSYDATVVGYGAGPGGRPVRHETHRKQVPSAALRVADGWLLGGDRGEWGGELVLLDETGRSRRLVDDNIGGLAPLGARVVAIGGLAHLSSNRGLVYEVIRDAKGNWSAHPWRVLPGAPWGSALESDGSLLIDTNGGTVVLSPDGRLRMATCRTP